MTRYLAFPLTAAVIALNPLAARAAYLDVSGNWSAPSTVPMSKGTALSVVSSCAAVQAYKNMAGTGSGAMIVAGPHTTATDNKVHLTVRLYKNNNHDKSCHVYVGKNNSYASCSCEYTE